MAAQGALRSPDGSTYEIISQMHMYPSDGTLAEITDWNFNGDLLDWKTVDAAGKHLVWKMDQHQRNNGKESVSRAIHFDSDGNQQMFGINQDGKVNLHAALANPIGE